MPTAIVTGAGGFVGSALVRHLASAGWGITAILRSHDKMRGLLSAPIPRRVRVEFGDVRSPHFLSRLVTEDRPDFIFHLAAHAVVSEAMEQPAYTIQNNVGAATKVLEVVRRHPGPKVIMASTDKALGEMRPGRDRYEDGDPLDPRGPYEASKACCDLIARAYRDAFGVPVAVLRPCNIYGPGDRAPSRLVPKVCRAIVENGRVALYQKPDHLREYLYVEDACRAYELAALHHDELLTRCEWNVSSGDVHRTSAVIMLFSSVADFEMTWMDGELPVKEIGDQALNGENFRRASGWAPRMGLQPGLRATLDWWRAHGTH